MKRKKGTDCDLIVQVTFKLLFSIINQNLFIEMLFSMALYLAVNELKAPHSVKLCVYPSCLQLKKRTGIIFILQWEIQLHIQGWNMEIPSRVSPPFLFFKRPHHKTLNTEKTTQKLSWQYLINYVKGSSWVCIFWGLKDASKYLSWLTDGITWLCWAVSG